MTPAPTDMSPLGLFLQADIVVKTVMIGLMMASIWTWAIIIERSRTIARLGREMESFEARFWKADSLEELDARRIDHPAADVFRAGYDEWRASTRRGPASDPDAVRQRLSAAMEGAIQQAIANLSARLPVLATVGAISPFVGLFGTVWGIMRAFIAIGETGQTSLAVVAPGIAEALFATALGLFAAIPAVIGYNRLLHLVGRLEDRLSGFAARYHAMMSRELDRG